MTARMLLRRLRRLIEDMMDALTPAPPPRLVPIRVRTRRRG
jgi:hypothetical protein